MVGMISMQGVPSSLIARNQSWVRQQAQALSRHLPSNVEKADLIQVGLIAVAQASLAFEWSGDRDSPQATEAFLRYARMRVKGAMLDELRQMDHLGRSQRRKIKVLQIARERWRSANGSEPSLARLSELCGIGIAEIAALEQADHEGRLHSAAGSSFDEALHGGAATDSDEVEARVDTTIVLRRLERFFASLPQRDRQVIDAYLGVGLTPVELAASLNLTPSRVSQMFRASVQRIARHFGHARASDRLLETAAGGTGGEAAVAANEAESAGAGHPGSWGRLVEDVLARPAEHFDEPPAERLLRVAAGTRWG
jgi:RNA polymerase sigma factor for flagellar operon FliA